MTSKLILSHTILLLPSNKYLWPMRTEKNSKTKKTNIFNQHFTKWELIISIVRIYRLTMSHRKYFAAAGLFFYFVQLCNFLQPSEWHSLKTILKSRPQLSIWYHRNECVLIDVFKLEATHSTPHSSKNKKQKKK